MADLIQKFYYEFWDRHSLESKYKGAIQALQFILFFSVVMAAIYLDYLEYTVEIMNIYFDIYVNELRIETAQDYAFLVLSYLLGALLLPVIILHYWSKYTGAGLVLLFAFCRRDLVK